MLKTQMTYTVVNWNDTLNKFLELSGWECTWGKGEWNCKFDKPVTFKLDFFEPHLLQHEQDYHYLYPGDNETHPINLNEIKTSYITEPYIKKSYNQQPNITYTLHTISMDTIIQYLQEQNELPNTPIMLTTSYC